MHAIIHYSSIPNEFQLRAFKILSIFVNIQKMLMKMSKFRTVENLSIRNSLGTDINSDYSFQKSHILAALLRTGKGERSNYISKKRENEKLSFLVCANPIAMVDDGSLFVLRVYMLCATIQYTPHWKN